MPVPEARSQKPDETQVTLLALKPPYWQAGGCWVSCWVLGAGDGAGLQFTIHNDNSNAPLKGPVFIALVYFRTWIRGSQ